MHFNPATVWFEQRTGFCSSLLRCNFNPATVWFERYRLHHRHCRNFIISIPQRSDLNFTKSFTGFGIDCISIPQRSDLNKINNIIKTIEVEKFQSRNGLIWTMSLMIKFLNGCKFQSRNGLIWTIIIYNKRSWIKKFQSRNGLIWTFYMKIQKPFVKGFQSRNGLIWTVEARADLALTGGFQSRNGLIWTQRVRIHLPCAHLNFNPATVWFELWSWRWWSNRFDGISIPQRSDLNEHQASGNAVNFTNFNPATVWFEPGWCNRYGWVGSWFQSRNGLIWTLQAAHITPC